MCRKINLRKINYVQHILLSWLPVVAMGLVALLLVHVYFGGIFEDQIENRSDAYTNLVETLSGSNLTFISGLFFFLANLSLNLTRVPEIADESIKNAKAAGRFFTSSTILLVAAATLILLQNLLEDLVWGRINLIQRTVEVLQAVCFASAAVYAIRGFIGLARVLTEQAQESYRR